MDIDDWRIALVVDPSLAPGFLANTVAVLAIGIGAACPRLAGDTLSDISGRSYRISANRPVPILQADNDAIRELFSEITASARERGGRAISIFLPEASTPIRTMRRWYRRSTFPQKELMALGLPVQPVWERSLTGALKLFR